MLRLMLWTGAPGVLLPLAFVTVRAFEEEVKRRWLWLKSMHEHPLL